MLRASDNRNLLLTVACAAVLSGCGADEVVSPGTGGNVTINNQGSGSTTTTTTTSGTVTPASTCPAIEDPAGLRDAGTISGPTGTWRVCELPARITRSTTLLKIPGVLYSLGGRVDVGLDRGAAPTADAPVVLTIAPGVIVYGATGVSWLAVNRGNRINAVGSAAQPIIFTSLQNVQGLNNDDSQGQWGGVVLLGRAPITDCTVAPSATPGSESCERQTEGAVDAAYFGGATPTDNSGTMRYVQIRYSGYVLSGNSELQSLTLGGTGSGTTIDHIQSHNSSDDGFEIFGGRTSMKHFVITGADDDSIDTDTGWKGALQYILAVQKTSGAADSMIELDSANTLEDQTPRTHLKLANFTFVHKNASNGNQAAILMRGGADATLINGVMTTPTACLRLNGANMLTTNAAIDKIGAPVFTSVAFQCSPTPFVASGGLTVQQVADTFNAGANVTASFTSTLSNVYINGGNETARPAGDPKTVDAFFDTTSYIGAVKDANDTWYAGWTCNSSYASFGSASKDCASLPTN